MSKTINDLEQQIMECWSVVDDIDMITTYFLEDPKFAEMDAVCWDELGNKYFAIKELYDVKFNRLWETFEKLCEERHNSDRSLGQGKSAPVHGDLRPGAIFDAYE